MAKKEKKALFKEQKKSLKSAQAAFSKFGEFELQGRKHIQKAIVHCYELYLEYEEDLLTILSKMESRMKTLSSGLKTVKFKRVMIVHCYSN